MWRISSMYSRVGNMPARWIKAVSAASVWPSARSRPTGPPGPPVTYRINDAAGNQLGTYTTPTYLRANRVDAQWNRINLVNLRENILPTRPRADLILKKGESHEVEAVALRRL